VILLFALDMQSLVDFAREEAERRKQLEQQGIDGKVIEGNGLHLTPDIGNITTSTSPPIANERASAKADSVNSQTSIRPFQTALKKLDREIQQNEARLASRQARLQDEKWESLKTGRSSSRGQKKDAKSQLQTEIEELQIKLKQLRNERFEVYESGRKAGFLPGELDGKGIIP
jgi:hypothetical protein